MYIVVLAMDCDLESQCKGYKANGFQRTIEF